MKPGDIITKDNYIELLGNDFLMLTESAGSDPLLRISYETGHVERMFIEDSSWSDSIHGRWTQATALESMLSVGMGPNSTHYLVSIL